MADLTRVGKGWVRATPQRHNGYFYKVQDDAGHFYYVRPAHAGKTVYKIDQPVYINYLAHKHLAFHTIEPRDV